MLSAVLRVSSAAFLVSSTLAFAAPTNRASCRGVVKMGLFQSLFSFSAGGAAGDASGFYASTDTLANGATKKFSDYKGSVIGIVNVASK